MKAILPVAGAGSRLRPHTHTMPKALVYVAGKPILGHILDSLETIGVDQIILILGEMGDTIIEYVSTRYRFKVSSVKQKERLGLGHAIYQAKEVLEDSEPVLIVLGDTIVRGDLSIITNNDANYIAVKQVEDPRAFGVAQVNNGLITGLEEKPEIPVSDLAICGLYYIRNSKILFEGLTDIITRKIKVKGEYQLTDALQRMVVIGEKVKPLHVNAWYDCGNPETLLLANKELLKKTQNTPHMLGDTMIIPPVSLDPTCEFISSIIGPYVSVAAGVRISHSIVRSSIINEGACVENALLKESLVGGYASVTGDFQKLNIGNSSGIKIG